MPKETLRKPLTRERVLSVAVRMADEFGVEKLSMRGLASELGFEVMSLYNHVNNKADLLVGMTDLAAAEIPLPDVDLSWREAVRAHAMELRAMFLRHPWVVNLWISTMPGPVRFGLMNAELATWNRADLPDHEAHHAYHAVNNHVVGYHLQNSMMPMQPDQLHTIADDLITTLDAEQHSHVIRHIHQHLDGDHGESFEYVLDLIIDGIGTDRR